ncbi:MAG: lamin tail domain-containing protein [Anaerolineae bacterium]|nr:lamin tail domain-containing protein [Anaerolineae bacterium]
MRRFLVLIIMVVILVGVGVLIGMALSSSSPTTQTAAIPEIMTVQLVITATTDPNVTPQIIIVTATPPPGSIGALPTGILEATDVDESLASTRAAAPTIDPELVGADSALQSTVTALPENCILHAVEAGDTPFGIAEIYGASGFDLMEVNGLTEETASQLQIGDVLIVPLDGCPLTAADLNLNGEVTEEAGDSAASSAAGAETTESPDADSTAETTAEALISPTPTVRPTITLPPTAVNAQVTIVQVISPGDVTAEAVEIRNTGGVVDMTGWTLADGDGNIYTFPEQRLFTNGSVTVNTRRGDDTPIARFWGRNQAVWGEPGDTITLYDANGVAQSSLRLDEASN